MDWALLSDSSATTLSTKLLSQSQLLTAYGPQTPVSIDYTSREMVESILVPTENGGSSQTFTLTMSFRVNEDVCCPNGLNGSFEVHDESGVMTSAMSLLLAQGQFSNAQQAMTTFTLTAINTAQSAATTIRRRRRRIPGARVLPWVVWTSLLVVVVIPMLLL